MSTHFKDYLNEQLQNPAFKAEYEPARSYRLSTKNFALNETELSIPLYAAFCI